MLEQVGIGRSWITAPLPLFLQPETKWYRVVRQFLVADPDGYLIRFRLLA